MTNKMSNTSQLVEKLVSKDLVTKSTSLYDLRAVDVSLNEKRISLVEQLSSVMADFENSILKLVEKETILLNELFEKIRNNQHGTY